MLEDGHFADAVYLAGVNAELTFPDARVIAVDIPIGFGPREADMAARRFVGPRASSVFPTPPRELLKRPFSAGLGLSRQSHALGERILHVTTLAARDPRIHEVHPEVSFRALAGRPLGAAKRTWNGANERRRLLAHAGIDVPDTLEGAGAIPFDDVLDAAAAAWSAARIARGQARRLPETRDQRDATGRLIAIWY